MIPHMTQPEDRAERRTTTVPIAGHEFLIKELTDVQVMHLNRFARILAADNVAFDAKSEAMDRMFSIVHNCVVEAEQLQFLMSLEEEGEVTLRDLVIFAKAFNEKPETAEPAVVRRRGRPRKSAS
jgi:hypothetical protein